MLNDWQRAVLAPYRPAEGTASAQFVYRRFNSAGKLVSEIGFSYRRIAEELTAKMLNLGHNVTLEVRGE